MTREATVRNLLTELIDMIDNGSQRDLDRAYEIAASIIKLFKQEPCEDEYIKVPKKALKYRTAGMVAYNAGWLKNHFDMERAVICGAQQPCSDMISRQATIDKIINLWADKPFGNPALVEIKDCIEKLPPVTPQQKYGKWMIQTLSVKPFGEDTVLCDQCAFMTDKDSMYNYCPNYGAKMQEEEE